MTSYLFNKNPTDVAWDYKMLIDAYNAINITGAWSNVRNQTEPFMLCNQPWLENIVSSMNYRTAHSYSTFITTMRLMHAFSKNVDLYFNYIATMTKVDEIS